MEEGVPFLVVIIGLLAGLFAIGAVILALLVLQVFG